MKLQAGKHELRNQTFSENHFLLENIQGGIVYSDFNIPFHLRYATEDMSELSGDSQNELLAMEQMDLVCEEDRELLLEAVLFIDRYYRTKIVGECIAFKSTKIQACN